MPKFHFVLRLVWIFSQTHCAEAEVVCVAKSSHLIHFIIFSYATYCVLFLPIDIMHNTSKQIAPTESFNRLLTQNHLFLFID